MNHCEDYSDASSSLTNKNKNLIEISDESSYHSDDSDTTIIESNIDFESIASKYIGMATNAIHDKIAPSYNFTDSSDSESHISSEDLAKLTYTPTCHKEAGNGQLDTERNAISNFNFADTNSDLELQSILKKYTSSTASTSTNIGSPLKRTASSVFSSNTCSEPIELSSDEDLEPVKKIKNDTLEAETCVVENYAADLVTDDLFEKYQLKFKNGDVAEFSKNLQTEHLADDPTSCSSPKKKRKVDPDRENKKMERAAQQAKKREEAERAKQLKQALAAANKNMKPEECIKHVKVFLDTEIANEKYGGEILNALQAMNATYRLQSQIIPYTVTWNRKVQKHFINDSEELTETSASTEADEALMIMNWNKIVELIHDKSLVQHVESVKSLLSNKKLSLAVYGLGNYFRFQKNQKQKEVRSEVTQSQASQKCNSKYDKLYKDVPKISKKQLELVLTELQILCSCCYRMVETPQDLGGMIAQYTKSIAQAPYKLEKHQKQQEAEWYMCGDNKDCVRVDKNGNGLQRLWQQQLTTFPLARLEHAEAIAAKYPTPLGLIEEYSSISSTEGEKLLQDIPIRRAAGPLTAARKIGSELSKKICKFFTATDGDLVL